AILIRLDFGGHGHGHQSTTVEGIVKDDNGRASGGKASDLDGVFDCLGTAVEEEGFLGKVARSYLADTFGKCNVWLIHHDAEAGMGEFGCLLGNGLCYFWAGVSNVHGTNAT